MKMRNIVASLIVGLTIASSNVALAESEVQLRAGTDLIYRGQDVTGSQGTMGLTLGFTDVAYEGVFVTGNFDTVEVTPLNENTSLRSDLEVGYKNSWNDVGYSVSLARVVNPVTYAEDYTELRARASYGYVYGEVGHGLTSSVNRDTYVGVGVEGELFAPNLTLGALASTVYYDTTSLNSGFEFNNVQVYASYPVIENLDVSAGYSVAGRTNAFDLDNHAWLSLSYTF